MSSEYSTSSPIAKAVFISVMVVFALSFCLILVYPCERGSAEYCGISGRIGYVYALLWGAHIFLSVYFLRLGLSSLKFSAFPPPNIAIPFRQPVLRNKKACAAAVGAVITSAVLIAQPFVWEFMVKKPIYTHHERKRVHDDLEQTKERIGAIKDIIESDK